MLAARLSCVGNERLPLAGPARDHIVAGAAVESAEVAEEVETAEIAANETVDPTIEAEVSTTEEN